MKVIAGLVMALFIAAMPCLADDQPDAASVIAKMQSQLDLQQDQVTNITPIIENFIPQFAQLQKSVQDGTINASAVESQRQQLEAEETQQLAQYLKPNQLSEWRDMQAQMDQPNGQDDSNNADQYSNLPNNNPKN